jgi:hypothetical protein
MIARQAAQTLCGFPQKRKSFSRSSAVFQSRIVPSDRPGVAQPDVASNRLVHELHARGDCNWSGRIALQ